MAVYMPFRAFTPRYLSGRDISLGLAMLFVEAAFATQPAGSIFVRSATILISAPRLERRKES